MSSSDTYRVLFVEDAFDQALLVKAFLGDSGIFEVTHTQDGDHALEMIRNEEWDLIITDLNLPGTDGFEVIRVGRAKNADLPILASTGYTQSEYHEQAFRAGANNLLTKPLDKDEFLSVVHGMVGAAAPGGAAAPEAAPGGAKTTILAVGGLAGDVEMGCGGTLLQAVADGKIVVVLPLSSDELDAGGKALSASKKACDVLGFRFVVDKAALDDTQRRMAVMEKAVTDLNPTVVYTPAMDDDHPSRMEAFRVAQAVTSDVATVLSYQTATTGTDFKPTHFVDVGAQLDQKIDAIGTFSGTGRLDLTADLATAYARYWGRFKQYAQVEAFEVVKGTP